MTFPAGGAPTARQFGTTLRFLLIELSSEDHNRWGNVFEENDLLGPGQLQSWEMDDAGCGLV